VGASMGLDAQPTNSVVTWAPLGYYCSATGRLYKHRSESASHHNEPCCQPVVLAAHGRRLWEAVHDALGSYAHDKSHDFDLTMGQLRQAWKATEEHFGGSA
jgi:hypothetical protein